MPDIDYPALIEGIKNRYADRIVAVLKRIRDHLVAAGIACDDVVDMSTDDYQWSFTAKPEGREQVGIDLEIAEAVAYGDERDDGQPGVTFALDIVAWSGQQLGSMRPFNYSDQVWVDATDSDAVEERFRLVEQGDASEVTSLVLQSPPAKEADDG